MSFLGVSVKWMLLFNLTYKLLNWWLVIVKYRIYQLQL